MSMLILVLYYLPMPENIFSLGTTQEMIQLGLSLKIDIVPFPLYNFMKGGLWKVELYIFLCVLERIVDSLIRQLVSVYDSQFGFVPGRGTTDALFVVRQLQEKYLAANKRLYIWRHLIEYLGRSSVGAEKTWCGGVDCATGAGDVCKCAEPCPCWWGVQWRVWSEGRCSPRLSTQPAALHYCAWSLITRVPLLGPLGGPLCRWPCFYCWIARGMCQEALDLERSNEKERTKSKCRKDDDHDLQYGPGPPAEFRRVFMCRLLHWSRQQ